jgi:hypothetical protein
MGARELLSNDLFTKWLQPAASTAMDVPVYVERASSRTAGLQKLAKLLADHYVGEATVLKMGGYSNAATTLLNSMPLSKRTRSGDLGELLATEYIDAQTSFRVPIRKLRWKDDRAMPMRGNDVIGVHERKGSVRVLKCESKSGVKPGASVVLEAANGLDRDIGRPNPSTLSFIIKRLYEENRDAEAKVFEKLQAESFALAGKNIEHLIFVFAGSDPSKHLAAAPKPQDSAIKRTAAAVVITDHADFVASVFEYGAKP